MVLAACPTLPASKDDQALERLDAALDMPVPIPERNPLTPVADVPKPPASAAPPK
jgi:hypothetical protein